jgi:homoserine dehydrogenase
VRPTAVGPGHLLHDVDDADNAVIISSDLASRVALRGLGAGGDSTASAVVSDVVNAVRERAAPRGWAPHRVHSAAVLSDEDVEVAGYVRLLLAPEPDARALVLQALEDRGLPVDGAVDLTGSRLIVLTGVAPRAVHDRALETLDTLTAVDSIESALDRVES